MKTNVLLVLSVLVCYHLRAQSDVVPVLLPALPQNAPETVGSQTGPVSGGIPPAESLITGNFTADNATAVDLAIVLANLQPQLERAMALLAAVNRGELQLPGASVAPPAAPVLPPDQPEPTSGQRLSDNRSVNYSSRHSENLSTNISVPAGLFPGQPAVSATPVATSSGVVRVGSVPVVVSKPVPPATYRSLASLEQQIRQMLPLVVAVNRNDTFRSLASAVTPHPAAGNGAATQPEPPTPTGRVEQGPQQPTHLRLR